MMPATSGLEKSHWSHCLFCLKDRMEWYLRVHIGYKIHHPGLVFGILLPYLQIVS
jgi:hypothetical protein